MGLLLATEKFWNENVDVHMFRLLLRNQLNDKFRVLHEQMKVAVCDLVRYAVTFSISLIFAEQ